MLSTSEKLFRNSMFKVYNKGNLAEIEWDRK
jgi:hypothetical protein